MTIEDKSSPPSESRPATASASSRKPDEDAVAVRVAVNIRPLVEQELAKGCQEILDVTPGTAQIQVGQHTFTYDNVYGSGGAVDAVSLYPDCVQPLVDGLFKGYNATVFAYGQTGSGKTYTMGSSWSPEVETQGVIPCVMDEMFGRIDAAANTDFTVKVSFVEIHKEEVRDLLWANPAAPRPVVTIRELPSGVSLAGACERHVTSREDMSNVLMQGTLMRAVASTNMNSRSSRSHAIFTITLEQRRRQLVRPASAPPAVQYTPGGTAVTAGSPDSSETDTSEEEDEEELEVAGDEYLIAKMHLVDLAGSERAKRTGAQGARLKEAININKGLLALAKVITALVENQSHVPYRDSKLTRLLQDSLGGNSRTVMIACVSPADINREESLNTLRYADRARRIKNKPVVNRDPVAAQLSALRQQIAGLRAENNALKNALGGDAAAMAVFQSRGQGVASEALQEAYDDLAVRCNALEVENAKQNMELDQAHNVIKLLRTGLLDAETQRDQTMLRLEALQQALAASGDNSIKAALQQDAAAAAAVAAPAQPGASAAASSATVSEQQQQQEGAEQPHAALASDVDGAAAATAAASAPAGVASNMGVIASLRARVLDLEAELRQARSLQRMTSNVIARGISVGGGLGSRAASTARVSAAGNKASRPADGHQLAMQNLAVVLSGVTVEHEDLGACSPMTPARQIADELDEPLMEVEPDAEVLAQSAAHMVAREAMALKLAVLGRQMEAKQKRLAALQGAADIEGAKTKYMLELQKERDTLAKEKTELTKKLQAVEAAGAEERKKLEQQYRDKLNSVEKRLKELAEKEKADKRNAAQLGRVQSVCQQLQADISRMKAARAAVQRRMEAKEKEFREWRLMREREVLQLRRNAQRQNAALQQHQAMHSKQQAVLKRKTEEAEAARRKLRDLLELQARARKDRKGSTSLSVDERGVPVEVELQPNATAPLLRTEKARRDWLDQELEMCTTSWQYQKVLEGELAQRAETTRKLREVQKQLMLLGGLVPPSPVVTAAAAAAAAASRGTGAAAAAAKAALPREDILQQDAAKLQAAIEKHSANVKELQEQWERARNDEQSRGAGAADVKRWTGIRNIVEARELLRTLFVSACSQKAQVCEGQMELAKLQEAVDILQIKLDMAAQQAAEAKRKALEAEATTAAVLTTPGHIAAAAGTSSDSDDEHHALARRLISSVSRQESSSGRTAAAAAAIAAAAAANRHEVGVADILGQLGSVAGAAGDEQEDHRDDVDIEADNLLHSMGLPPIMEMPSPAHTAADLPGNRVLTYSNSKNRCSAGASQDHNTRYQALVKCKYGSWRSTPSASGPPAAAGPGSSGTTSRASSSNLGSLPSVEVSRDRASSDGTGSAAAAGTGGSAAEGFKRPERSGSSGLGQAAQDLAAKLDALEVDWKGYKRNVPAAGNTRRSITGGSRQGRSSYGSLPGSPAAHAVGSIGMSYGKPGSALREPLQHGSSAASVGAARVRGSVSACSSPVDGLIQQHADGDRAAGFWPHQQEQEAPDKQDDEADGPGAAVVKELKFLEVDGMPSPTRASSKDLEQQQQQQCSRAGSKPQRRGRRRQEVSQYEAASSGYGSRRSSLQQQGEQQQQDEVNSDLDGDESDGSDDDEDNDPSYDPAIHGTPAVARGRGRRASRDSKAHNSRLSTGSADGQPSSASTTSARVAGRWGARDNRVASTSSRPSSGNTAAPSAFSSAAGSSRSLAAQVSFNHEKRREWEKPVLEDINTQRAGQGLAAVDKLTIQVLKDCMAGKELDGKLWVAGAKTRDNLIAEYRRMLNLGEETDIDRITGAATWSMPASPISSGEESPGETAGSRGRHDKDGSRSIRRSNSLGPAVNAIAGARRIPSNMFHMDTQNLPSCAPDSSSPSPTRMRTLHSIDGSLYRNSPARAGLAAAGRIRAGSPPGSSCGSKAGSDGSSRLVSQSVDYSLLTAAGGAQRVPGSPVAAGALQESAQRSVQKSNSQKPLRISIPFVRADGPYSCRLPSSHSGLVASGGSLEPKGNQQGSQQADRSSKSGQPSWR